MRLLFDDLLDDFDDLLPLDDDLLDDLLSDLDDDALCDALLSVEPERERRREATLRLSSFSSTSTVARRVISSSAL